MFKSSPLTKVMRILYPLMMIFLVVFFFYRYSQSTEEVPLRMFVAAILMLIWMLAFTAQMPFRLKYIEADEKGIHIQEKDGKRFVEYGDINLVTKFDPAAPSLITVRYIDRASGIEKKFGYMPERRSRMPMGDDELTEYIKNNIYTRFPEYEDRFKKIQRRNYLIFVGTSIVFIILFYLLISGRINII